MNDADLEQALLAAGDRGAGAQDLAYTLRQTADTTRRHLLAAPWAQQAQAKHRKARRWFHQDHAQARLAYEAALRRPRGKAPKFSADTAARIAGLVHASGADGMNRRELIAASGLHIATLQEALPHLVAHGALVDGVDSEARSITGKRYWTPRHAPAMRGMLRKPITPRKVEMRLVPHMTAAAVSVEEQDDIGASYVKTIVRGHVGRFERRPEDPPLEQIFGGRIGRYEDNDNAIGRAYGDPCTCKTPSGMRHCPEHFDRAIR